VGGVDSTEALRDVTEVVRDVISWSDKAAADNRRRDKRRAVEEIRARTGSFSLMDGAFALMDAKPLKDDALIDGAFALMDELPLKDDAAVDATDMTREGLTEDRYLFSPFLNTQPRTQKCEAVPRRARIQGS
jgi:hypothetical protein